MAFGKSIHEFAQEEREFDPSVPNDKRILLEFEQELKPYREKSKTLFRGTGYQVTLNGFWLYLHDKNLFRYSNNHKTGAVVVHGSEGTARYMEALRKYRGLYRLMEQRGWRQAQEQEALAGIGA